MEKFQQQPPLKEQRLVETQLGREGVESYAWELASLLTSLELQESERGTPKVKRTGERSDFIVVVNVWYLSTFEEE